jgi:hypothetical protein
MTDRHGTCCTTTVRAAVYEQSAACVCGLLLTQDRPVVPDFVYSTHATDYAMNARYTYHVNNVHAYGEGILAGWSPGNKACSTDPAAKCPKYLPPATNCYVYNATFYMLGEGALCSAGISNTPGTLDSSVIHTNATSLGACVPPLATAANKLAAPASDAAVTAAARAVMGDYPKPYDA